MTFICDSLRLRVQQTLDKCLLSKLLISNIVLAFDPLIKLLEIYSMEIIQKEKRIEDISFSKQCG